MQDELSAVSPPALASLSRPLPPASTRLVLQPQDKLGWVIQLDGESHERHSFVDKRLALEYAKQWAHANRPSHLIVLDARGSLEHEWRFISAA